VGELVFVGAGFTPARLGFMGFKSLDLGLHRFISIK